MAQIFKSGDKVEVRNGPNENWLDAVVVSVQPLKVDFVQAGVQAVVELPQVRFPKKNTGSKDEGEDEVSPEKPADILDRFITVYVDWPHACCGGCCCAMLLLSVISIMSGCMGMTLEVESAWDIHEAQSTQWINGIEQAAELARETDEAARAGGSRRLGSSFPWITRPTHRLEAHAATWGAGAGWQFGGRRLQDEEEEQHSAHVAAHYKADSEGGNIFTPARLRDICLLEAVLLTDEALLVTPHQTPIKIFYGSGDGPPLERSLAAFDWACPELSPTSVEATVSSMLTDVRQHGAESAYAAIVHPDFRETGVSTTTRSYMVLQPSHGSESEWDSAAAIGPLFQHFDPPLEASFLGSPFLGEDDRFVPVDSIRVRFWYGGWEEFETVLMQDFSVALGSIVIVFLIMWAHLNSSFLAAVGMYQIILSLPLSSIIYRGILQINYFEFLHILTVYLILGIGADDIFVLADAWRHISADVPGLRDRSVSRDDLKRVLRQVYVRTARAIFNTSFTTAVAFLSCSVSRLMPMRTTGWYAAICIIMCYIQTITFTPSVLVIYYLRFEGKRFCCPLPTSRLNTTSAVPQAGTADVSKDEGGTPNAVHRKEPLIERAIAATYIPLMSWKVGPLRPVALGVVVAMLATAVQGAYFASQLTPPRTSEVWFPLNHMWVKLGEYNMENYFAPDYDRFATISFFWGIAGFDTSGVDSYDPDSFKGTVQWDDAFDLSTAEAQASVLELCREMQTAACSLDACQNTGYGTLMLQSTDKTYSCFLEDFQEWLSSERGIASIPTGSAFFEQLQVFRDEADPQRYSSGMAAADYREDVGFVGGRLRFVRVKMRSTLPEEAPFGSGVVVRDLVDDFAVARRNEAPSSMRSLKYVAGHLFAGYDLGEELILGLFSGCAIAAPMAFLVLLLSTNNIVVAVYAVMSVASIVLCVLGFCKSAKDWDLGVGEAIAGVIVIGLSVDYVVHLAHMYCEAAHYGLVDRSARAEFAVRNMGSTVFAGAVTTAASGSVMFMCFFTFFPKMALLITMTIFFSFLFSLGFFMGLLWVGGPEGKFGNLPCDPSSLLQRLAGKMPETSASKN